MGGWRADIAHFYNNHVRNVSVINFSLNMQYLLELICP